MLSQLLKKWLRSRNRVLAYSSYDISGCHFPDDLRRVVGNNEPTCMDVGAHWGETTEEFLKIFKKPTIHSFEPAEGNFKILQSKQFPDHVHRHNFALGSTAAQREFTIYGDSTDLNSFCPLSEEGVFGSKSSSTAMVDVQTTDAFLAENAIPHVDLLKIDTQGFEMEVLRGAEETLKAHKIQNLLLEVNFMELCKGQPSFGEILEFLNTWGYQFVDFYGKARRGHALAWSNALFTSSATR